MRRVRWGVLGTADIARGQTIPGMQLAEHCELYAIAGRKLEKAKLYQEEFGFRKAYGSYDELLADPEVEAVYIPLPNDIHCEWTIKALKAKKHVLCEKPLAVSEAQAKEMFRAAEENGVLLMEAFAYLHSPFVKAVKEELDAGVIGEIRYLESAFITGRRPDTDIRLRKETYGGALYDLGCYAVSMAMWMLGKEPDAVRAAASFSEKQIDLFTSALLLYDNGLIANLDCGMLLPTGRLDRFHIHGTLGEIVSPVEFNQCGEIPYTIIRNGVKETKTVTAPNNYALESEQLSRCILFGEKPQVSKEFSLLVARVTDRILKEIGY
ncbi:MAG: Gfo/Idh/MocA family oxidoreductase [Clostridia bacterium]|nr:Gfo/Idh/MocA family oxidoreductase [Clostridia bacterium]